MKTPRPAPRERPPENGEPDSAHTETATTCTKHPGAAWSTVADECLECALARHRRRKPHVRARVEALSALLVDVGGRLVRRWTSREDPST